MGGEGPEEVLYRSERTVVTRTSSPRWGGAVVRTVRTGPEARRRLANEAAILRAVSSAGVPRVLSDPTDPDLVVEDVGARSLAGPPSGSGEGGRWEPAELLDLAVAVTSVLADVHRQGVIHRDISPANIVVHGPHRTPVLIDFEFATTLSDEQSLVTNADEIRGTLAYLAPEQTGRTGRAVDQRTDLYALGATLYELAAGRPPFGQGEEGALALIHDHLARQPAPLAEARPDLPAAFGAVLARLLEKEPDRRYQSADGLLHDLRLVRAAFRAVMARGPSSSPPEPPIRLGTLDFPLRFGAPARPVARDREIDAQAAVFAEALTGSARALLVVGPAGVGKTALVDELRPVVTEAGGWFVTANVTPDGRSQGLDAGVQALGALARVMLGEPENRLLAHRRDLLAALGDKAGLLAGVLPEFALLLDVPPEPPTGDPVLVQAAVVQAGLAVLRAVPRSGRPLVLLFDGLQWASAFPLELLDAVLTGEVPDGLLVVGTYRDDEVDAAHPLAAMLSRWYRLGVAPQHLRLDALDVPALGGMLAEVLRLDPADAARLAGLLHTHTRGNPYDTIELLNALRRDGALAPGADGWTWDDAVIHGYVGAGARADLLATRIGALPDAARGVLEVMACLDVDADLGLLEAATDVRAAELHALLAPSLADGLLVTGAAGGDLQDGATLRLRHDHVRSAVLDRLGGPGRHALHLDVARRLAGRPDHRSTAAEQYLQAAAELPDAAERHRVVDLFAAAAADLRVTNPAAAERYLGAAVSLLGTGPDTARALSLRVARHAALYSLGRFDEADVMYRSIRTGLADDGLEPFSAGAVQIASLTNRARPQEAVALGLQLLGELGLAVPTAEDLPGVVARDLDEFYAWVAQDAAADRDRPEIADLRVRAAAEIISVLMPPAFFSDQDVMAWLVLESRRLWAEHGPCRALVGALCHAAVVTIGVRQDFTVGYQAVRRVRDASVARRYEPETSRARFLFAVSAGHWFEPLEDVLEESRLAREGLLNGGDSQGAVFTYHSTTPTHLDTAAHLDEYLATVDAGLALADRTGNDQTVAAALPYRHLATVLRGTDPGTEPDDVLPLEASGNPMATVNGHLTRALLAALLGDQENLVRHARAAVALLPFLCGHYAMARVHLLHALALAGQLRHGGQEPAEAQALLAELDGSRDWIAARATDNAATFAHLLSLVDAERAWALGDVAAARAGFDRALQQVSRVDRPWQRAYLLERAALFALGQGEDHLAGVLLGLARRAYATWGAQAKVDQLDRTYPFLRGAGPDIGVAAGRSSVLGISADTIDLLSVLKASQALSRETELDLLRLRVVDVLTAMTGATSVTVLLKSQDGAGWELAAPEADTRSAGSEGSTGSEGSAGSTGSEGATGSVGADGPAEELADLVPLSVVRYVARTGEPVVLADATSDHRFGSDPYLAAAGSRSLLVVPILSRGEPRVMLVLENRLHRGVFAADRLDAVMLIAGQLAVSFDIALARRQLEREADRRLHLLGTLQARERLLETLLAIQRDISHRAPLQRVLDAVTAGASGLLGGDYVALVLADPTSSSLPRVPSVSGVSPGPEHDDSVLAAAAESIAADTMVFRAGGGGAPLTAVPVHVSGEIIGSLVTRIADDGVPLDDRRDLLAAFAEQVSLALNDATTLQAIRAASLDSLTGLATRPLFLDRLEKALTRRNGRATVLFIDLDRFKQVNDTLGHDAGDQLLSGVAERIRACIRDDDTGARLGGDEFAILLEDTPGPQAGLRVGESLIAALNRPILVAGKEIFATGSIGVAVHDTGEPVTAAEAGAAAAELLKQADLAMYRAKRERARRPVLFEQQMHEDVSQRLDLEGDLERAVASRQLWLQFQPQVRLDGSGAVGVEALVRWTHPERGPISPAEFVPIAEDTGVIVDLGRWVLREACRQAARWRRDLDPELRLSVNVSGRQLGDGRLAQDVRAVLAETGLDPAALTLELTESVLMNDPAESLARLQELKRLGVRLALDDFGTGYSSLSYLHRFPVDELKIDRSFVEKIDSSDADLAIVRVVVELGRILNLRTTAEGVETEAQRDLLAAIGCQVGQGYLFARPLNREDVPAFLARRQVPRQLPPQDSGRADRSVAGA